MNKIFDGDVSERTETIYIQDVIKRRLLESEILIRQAQVNRKEQFRISPDLISGVRDLVNEACDTHEQLSRQLLESRDRLEALLDRLIVSEDLYEELRNK